MKISKSKNGYNIEELSIKELIDIRIALTVRISESCDDLKRVKEMEYELYDYIEKDK